MIVVRMIGGLGNQMFQYAYARSLQDKYQEKVILDCSGYKNDKQRYFSLSKCNIRKDIIISKGFNEKKICFLSRIKRRIYCELKFKKEILTKEERFKKYNSVGVYQSDEFFKYYPFIKSNSKNKYVYGYWQSEKYFKEISQSIKNELLIKEKPSKLNEELIEKISMENSICVHIRRGDYTWSSLSNKLLICDFAYYNEAINYMLKKVKNPKFYIFSNNSKDIEWIKENYKFDSEANIYYVNLGNPDYEEIRLMYSCKNFILSNSSFSWWAAYLASYNQKIVITPSEWYRGEQDYRDVYCKEWIRLNIK